MSKLGIVVKDVWLSIPEHFKNIKLDEFVVMPNHIHGIVVIKKNSGREQAFSTMGNGYNGREQACLFPTRRQNEKLPVVYWFL